MSQGKDLGQTCRFTGKISAFGDLLKYLRKREELTQREFAILVGYSDTQISRLEQNQRVPDAATLRALFVPALHLEHEPEWVARLLELAKQARLGELSETGTKFNPNNLPASLTTFIGREKEKSEILQLIGTHRLVTLTGSGGVGKTRLSLKVGGVNRGRPVLLYKRFPMLVWSLYEDITVDHATTIPFLRIRRLPEVIRDINAAKQTRAPKDPCLLTERG